MTPNLNAHYVLDNHVPYVEPEEDKWLWWMKNENHPVAVTFVGDTEIRTEFMGKDMSGSIEPQLFRTRLFGGDAHDLERYSATWQEASERHERVTQRLIERQAAKPKKRGKPVRPMPNDPYPVGTNEYHTLCQKAADAAVDGCPPIAIDAVNMTAEQLLLEHNYVDACQLLARLNAGHYNRMTGPTQWQIARAKQIKLAYEKEADRLVDREQRGIYDLYRQALADKEREMRDQMVRNLYADEQPKAAGKRATVAVKDELN